VADAPAPHHRGRYAAAAGSLRRQQLLAARNDSDDDDNEAAPAQAFTVRQALLQISSASVTTAAPSASNVVSSLFDSLLAAAPGAVATAHLDDTPWTRTTARRLMQRMQSWCERSRAPEPEEALLYALDSERGRQLMDGVGRAYVEQRNAASTSATSSLNANIVPDVLLPLLYLLLREDKTLARICSGGAARPLHHVLTRMMFAHGAAMVSVLSRYTVALADSEEAGEDLRVIATLLMHVLTSNGAAQLRPEQLEACAAIADCLRCYSGADGDTLRLQQAASCISGLIFSGQPSKPIGGASAASASAEAAHGDCTPKHDNDARSYRAIRLIPTRAELLCTTAPHLPPSTAGLLPGACTDGSAVVDCTAWLDRHFRLLREDLIGPLREEIAVLAAYITAQDVAAGAGSAVAGAGASASRSGGPARVVNTKTKAHQAAEYHSKRLLRRTYQGVVFQRVVNGDARFQRPVHFRVRFTQPKDLLIAAPTAPAAAAAATPPAVVKSLKQRQAYWEDSNSLSRGSLVCFVRPSGQAVRFGLIVGRQVDELANDSYDERDKDHANHPDPTAAYIGVQIIGESRDIMETLASLRAEAHGDAAPHEALLMVQVSAAFFAYEPILRRLQSTTMLPFPELLYADMTNAAQPAEISNPALTRALQQLEQLARAGKDVSPMLQLPRSSAVAAAAAVAAKGILLDESQVAAINRCLTCRLPLLQGPPGTGQ
jgi:hypothetical protein